MSYNKKTILFPLVAAAAAMIGLIIGVTITRTSHENFLKVNRTATDLRLPAQDKMSTILSLIRSDYLEKVNIDSLTESLIPELMQQLDPHSGYIPASELARVNEPLEAEFDGVGVTFNMLTDTVQVINVIPRGPSDRAGIIGGDRIITVNDTLIAGVNMDQNDVMRRLRGKRGTKVRLGIMRLGTEELMQVEVTRDKIPVKSLDAAIMITPRIGYIKLSRFARTSHREVVMAIDELKKLGMEKLIFDLKGNLGGYLDQGILIANEFLPDKTLILYTEGRTRESYTQYSDGKGRYPDLDLVLLVDENTASSSEIVAGALQDNDRGTIIGRRTFGKGLVQEQIPLYDGSAIRLTVARYHTPTGRFIQKPYDDGNEAYYNDIRNRYLHNEMLTADSIRLDDSLRYTTPKGKIVYGGGGIMPDVFVPMDTTRITDYLRQVIARNLIFRYTMIYSDRHRAQLNAIRTLDQAETYFRQQGDLLPDFVQFAAREGCRPKGNELKESESILRIQLKAYIMRNTPLDDNAFYYFIYPLDEIVNQAVEMAVSEQV